MSLKGEVVKMVASHCLPLIITYRQSSYIESASVASKGKLISVARENRVKYEDKARAECSVSDKASAECSVSDKARTRSVPERVRQSVGWAARCKDDNNCSE